MLCMLGSAVGCVLEFGQGYWLCLAHQGYWLCLAGSCFGMCSGIWGQHGHWIAYEVSAHWPFEDPQDPFGSLGGRPDSNIGLNRGINTKL